MVGASLLPASISMVAWVGGESPSSAAQSSDHASRRGADTVVGTTREYAAAATCLTKFRPSGSAGKLRVKLPSNSSVERSAAPIIPAGVLGEVGSMLQP